MSAMSIFFTALVFDIILVPPLLIITVASNLLWIVSIASRLGRFGMPFVFMAVFSIATSCGYLLISADQNPNYHQSVIYDDNDARDDCERYPGPYGC